MGKRAMTEDSAAYKRFVIRNRVGQITFNTTKLEAKDVKEFEAKLIEAEQYLNSKVALELLQKFDIGFRFHI